MNKDEIVYSITVEDLQAIAKVIYGKRLTKRQLERITPKIGNYFEDWFDKIELAIDDNVKIKKLDEPDWDAYPY